MIIIFYQNAPMTAIYCTIVGLNI